MTESSSKLHGLIAQFETPEALLAAAHQTTAQGYTRAEAYTPFPIDGLSDALGYSRTPVAAMTFIAGLLGGLTGFGMCWYANVINYPINIGGRPNNSWPAWIPITFELTVLFAALTAAFGMLYLNGLPRLHHPIFNAPHFDRASHDRFFLCIEATDPRFAPDTVHAFLQSLHPLTVEEVPDMTPRLLTLFISSCLRIFVCPLALTLTSCKRDDMTDQVKLKPYAASAFYADGASARPLVPHTLAITDDIETPLLDVPAGLNILGRWQNPLPASATFPFPITVVDLKRGQQRFEIFCTPCHGQTGDGNGMIPQRGFTRPPTYHSDRLRNAPVNYFYNVITNGLGAMYPYNDRIPSDDRWRIAAYIRALQLSQYAPLSELSASTQPSGAPHE